LLLVSETGAEASARPSWLHYVCGEVGAAMSRGVPVAGICLYPITEYHGWENDRICQVSLLSVPDDRGRRMSNAGLLAELERQSELFAPKDMSKNSLLRIAR
jgi:hypothetical protein